MSELELAADACYLLAKILDNKFLRFCDSPQQSKLVELFSYSSLSELQSSPLVNKFMYVHCAERCGCGMGGASLIFLSLIFRSKKYFMRMSEGAFELLMQFLQV